MQIGCEGIHDGDFFGFSTNDFGASGNDCFVYVCPWTLMTMVEMSVDTTGLLTVVIIGDLVTHKIKISDEMKRTFQPIRLILH